MQAFGQNLDHHQAKRKTVTNDTQYIHTIRQYALALLEVGQKFLKEQLG